MQLASTLRHVPFPVIGEFRKVIKAVNDACLFHKLATKPKLCFIGTTKMHGSNASVVLQRGGRVYAQSREYVLTEELRLHGFYDFVEATLSEWQTLLEELLNRPEHAEVDTIVLYGEWCDGQQHKGIAIHGLPPMFVLFKLKTQVAGMVTDNGVKVPGFISTYHPLASVHQLWLNHIKTSANEQFASSVYSVAAFDYWVRIIDFNSPQESQNWLGTLTQEVEKECPAGKFFGRSGIGEGVVWTCMSSTLVPFRTDKLMFKVKGQEHSDTNVKVLANVDVETIQNEREFADLVATEHRFEKGVDHLRQQLGDQAPIFTQENTGVFVRWVLGDVKKEQMDTLQENNLQEKSVLQVVALRAKNWFISKS